MADSFVSVSLFVCMSVYVLLTQRHTNAHIGLNDGGGNGGNVRVEHSVMGLTEVG